MPAPPRVSSAEALGLTLILVTAAVLRAVTLGAEGLWLDESVSVLLAILPWSEAMEAFRADKMAPLYPLVLRGWMGLFGLSETAVRALSALAGLATLPLVWRLGRELASRAAGLWAGGLLAVSPLAIHYSQEARPYAFLMLALAGALLTGLRILNNPTRPRTLGFWACLSALPLLHHVGTLLAAGVVSGLLLARPGPGVVRRLLAGAALALAAWSLWAGLVPEPFLEARERSTVSPEGPTHTRLVRTASSWTPATQLPVRNRVRAVPPLAWPCVVIMMLLALYAAWRWPWENRGEARALLVAVPVVYLALLAMVDVTFVEVWIVGRTDSALLPVFLVLVAAGLARLPLLAGAASGGLLVLMAVPGLTTHYAVDFRSQERILAAQVLNRAEPEDTVLVTGKWIPTLWYYRHRLPRPPSLASFPPGHEVRPVNPGWEQDLGFGGIEEAARQVAQRLARRPPERLWLVLDQGPLYEPLRRALDEDWRTTWSVEAPAPLPVELHLMVWSPRERFPVPPSGSPGPGDGQGDGKPEGGMRGLPSKGP